MSDKPLNKEYLKESFKYLIDTLREQLNDSTIVGAERNKLLSAFREALAKSVTLVRETDQDILNDRIDELTDRLEKILGDRK